MNGMTSGRSSGTRVRKARAMRARALGFLLHRSLVAIVAWRRRQREALRRAAALDELSQRGDWMLRDIGFHRSQLFQLREGRR
jgi:hypothetical protein